jgi:hypothetical protein
LIGSKLQSALLSPVTTTEKKIPEEEKEEGEVISPMKKFTAVRSYSNSSASTTRLPPPPPMPQDSRKKPSRWGRPIATADPIRRSDSNHQDYRSRPIYHHDSRRDIVCISKYS